MIKSLGKGRYRVDFHPGRNKRRVRKIVKGTRETAQEIEDELRARARRKKFGLLTESKLTINELADTVVHDYEDNNRKSIKSAREMRKIWIHELGGGTLAEDVSSDDLKELARKWRSEGLTNGRVNRRMSFIIRGYNLAISSDEPKVSKKLKWKKLKESAPRSGFFEWDEFRRLREELPLHAKIPVTIEHWTGMRAGEVHGLQWPQIRFEHHRRTVFIQLSDSKSDEPRLVAMVGDLYDTLNYWKKYTDNNQPGCPWVCHYNGKRLGSIKTAWQIACVKIGLGEWTKDGRFPGNRGYRGRTVHDLRRTGVRNLIRAGVPERIAMKISGHKTRAMIDRYNIVSEKDLVDAGRLVAEHHEKHYTSPSSGGQPVDTTTSLELKTSLKTHESSPRPADS